jgi:DNA repair protein RadA/Sms
MKVKTKFICQSCSYETSKWLGKCPDCNEWNTFEESQIVKKTEKTRQTQSSVSQPKKLSEVQDETQYRVKTGNEEFDRVLGGGLVIGSLNLVGGEPGIGKSTLLLEICGRIANLQKKRILYISGEESEYQVAQRAKRLGINQDNLLILNETIWENILVTIEQYKPILIVLDSIQTTVSSELTSSSGTVSQIREVTYELMNYSKGKGVTSFVIGHVTKEGQLAGPKVLEHMVDSVIYFEGDQNNHYRILRAIKNRFGDTNEVGLFEMRSDGLKQVKNTSQYFLDGSLKETYGRCVTCINEGTRTLFVEIQSLVVENKFGNGRRVTQGIDQNRLSMIVAIIEKYFEIPLSSSDIYINVIGGVKVQSRDVDFAILSSILSSYYKKCLSDRHVFLGEVGLSGEVRKVSFLESRLTEMDKLNYKKIFTPKDSIRNLKKKLDIELVDIKKVTSIQKLLFV